MGYFLCHLELRLSRGDRQAKVTMQVNFLSKPTLMILSGQSNNDYNYSRQPLFNHCVFSLCADNGVLA